MRIRSAAALFALSAVYGVLAACSGDDDITPAPTPGTDAGGVDATTNHDAGGNADATPPGTDAGSSDAGASDSATPDAAPDGTSDAGPQPVTVPFDPTGTGVPDAIYWDDAKKTLFITDDNNAIWTWTDAAGLKKVFTLPNTSPDAGAAGKLNGITELPDGTLVVTQFGFAAFGGLLTVAPDGGTTVVPNVPIAARRIAVVRDPASGALFSDSFQKVGAGQVGVVESVSLDSGTTTIASGFQKPVGLLVQGATLLVVDQNVNNVYALPTDPAAIGDGGLADGAAYPIYATLPSPDQLTGGPNGSVFTGQLKPTVDGGNPQVRQIFPDGGVSTFAPDAGFTSLSDVAYDATGKRLFIVDSNGTTLRTIKIYPVQ